MSTFWLGLALWILLMLTLPILFSADPSVRSGQLPNPGMFLLHTDMEGGMFTGMQALLLAAADLP